MRRTRADRGPFASGSARDRLTARATIRCSGICARRAIGMAALSGSIRGEHGRRQAQPAPGAQDTRHHPHVPRLSVNCTWFRGFEGDASSTRRGARLKAFALRFTEPFRLRSPSVRASCSEVADSTSPKRYVEPAEPTQRRREPGAKTAGLTMTACEARYRPAIEPAGLKSCATKDCFARLKPSRYGLSGTHARLTCPPEPWRRWKPSRYGSLRESTLGVKPTLGQSLRATACLTLG